MFPPRKPEATRRCHGDARKRRGRFLGPKPQQPGVASRYPQPWGSRFPLGEGGLFAWNRNGRGSNLLFAAGFWGMSRVAAAILTGLTSRGYTKKGGAGKRACCSREPKLSSLLRQ